LPFDIFKEIHIATGTFTRGLIVAAEKVKERKHLEVTPTERRAK